MKTASRTVQRRILLLALLPSALISVLMCSLYLWARFAELDQQLVTKAEEMTHRLATFVVYSMESGELQNTRNLAIQALDDTDIRAVSLLDRHGQELLHVGPNLFPIGMAQPLPSSVSLYTTDDTLRAIAPVVRRKGDASETLGWLQLEYAYSTTRIQKYRATLPSIIFLVLAIGVAFSLCMALSRSLIKLQNMELDLARKKALETSRNKSGLLAYLSHEIRTPLNGISGYTALLLETGLTSQQREYLSTIKKSAQGLMTLLNDILDFSRIEAGKLELHNQPLSIREVVDDVLAIMAPAAHQKSLELVSFIYEDTPEEIMGDQQRLSQILINLVGNAVKFTHDGSVAIRVMLEQVDDADIHTLKFTVTDTGPGLASQQHSRIFKAFSQADSNRTRRTEGAGLGLAISKGLVEQMQGEIGLDSDPGRGSTFWFTIKTRSVQGENVLFKPEPIPGCHHVLLYEPQELSRLAIGHQVQSLGLKVTSFQSLAELHRHVETHNNHDLLLLSQTDDHVQHTIGIAKNHLQQSPVLILAMAGNQHHPETLPTGIRCLLKPVARNKLLLAIQGMTSKRRQGIDIMLPAKMVFRKPLDILVVDDNPVNLKLLKTILLKIDQSVAIASNGLEAIELCHQKAFDLVLMDVQMPEIDGLETTRRIRNIHPIHKRIPIIAVTAHALPEERKQILQGGMDDCMIKPVNTRQLVATIRHWIGHSVKAPDVPMQEPIPGQVPSTSAPVDEEQSIQLAAGNQALAKEMLDKLLDGLADDLQTIEASFRDSLHGPLLERVHRLHGACRYCAIPTLLDACQALETGLKQTTHLNSPNIIHGVEKVIKAIKELQEWQASREVAT